MIGYKNSSLKLKVHHSRSGFDNNMHSKHLLLNPGRRVVKYAASSKENLRFPGAYGPHGPKGRPFTGGSQV